MNEQKPEGKNVGWSALLGDTQRLMKRCQVGVGGRNALDEAHSIMAECYGTLGRLSGALEDLELHATRGIAPGWVGVPEVEWDAVMTPNAKAQGLLRPEGNSDGK